MPDPELPQCRCAELSCPLSKPCTHPVTQEDWLCDLCRAAKELPPDTHCHECGDDPDDAGTAEAGTFIFTWRSGAASED